MRCFTLLAAMVLALAGSPAQANVDPAVTPPVSVMVVGTYHFANPGLDEHNIETQSVLTPQRQAELERVSAALAAFAPTHVMVEMVGPLPDYSIPAYRRFDPRDLQTDANEIVQIGFRLAHRLRLNAVYGIDVQAGPGEEDYFPIARVRAAAERSGQTEILRRLDEDAGAWVKRFGASQEGRSIANLLIEINSPGYPGDQSYYDRLLPIGHEGDLAGAHLNARWYARNVAIFAKLTRIAKPGDRVVVIYGAGHLAWLRHFAGTVAGYADIDPIPFLQQADR